MGHEHNPADVYPALLKAFNAGDIDAIVACYEPQACFVLKSGHAARGAAELREMYRATRTAALPGLASSIHAKQPAEDVHKTRAA
jgi:ketosteroid isomerase-like protein